MTNPSGPLSVKEADTGLDRVIPKTQIGNEPSVGFFVSLEIQNCCQTHWVTTCGGGNQQRPEWALNTHKTTSEWVLVGITCKVRVYAGVKRRSSGTEGWKPRSVLLDVETTRVRPGLITPLESLCQTISSDW